MSLIYEHVSLIAITNSSMQLTFMKESNNKLTRTVTKNSTCKIKITVSVKHQKHRSSLSSLPLKGLLSPAISNNEYEHMRTKLLNDQPGKYTSPP